MQMDEFTQRNAEMAQQTSSVAGSMTSQAKALTDLISVFKVQHAAPVPVERVQIARLTPVAAKPTAPPAPPAQKVAGSDVQWQEF